MTFPSILMTAQGYVPSSVPTWIEAVVTASTDSRAGNVMRMLFVGGRAYAGRNGDLQESC